MQLVKWARQGEMGFELRINNPPYFMPFDASDRPNFPANDCELILHNAQILYLSRAATECAFEHYDLPLPKMWSAVDHPPPTGTSRPPLPR